ncbi:hypothetical protein WOB59_06530 [Methylocystis sp. IM4]
MPATEQDIFDALGECDAKLPALASHYGIDLSELRGPLLLCLALARAHVPGFQIELRQPIGRPKKPAALDIQMLLLLEGAAEKYGERGAKARLARELADHEERALAKREGRRPTKANAQKIARTIQNDLSRLDKGASRLLARIILDGIEAGKSLEQITEEAPEIIARLSHEKSPEK